MISRTAIAFKDANSKGTFLFENIKGKYKYHKIQSIPKNSDVNKFPEDNGERPAGANVEQPALE